jgi:hypothetical protein
MSDAAAAALVFLLASACPFAGWVGAAAAETTVFRCEVPGGVLYSDAPCANAEVLNVDGGNPAPDARARLARDRRLLDEAASQRRAAMAQDDALRAADAARRAEAERFAQARQQAEAAGAYDYPGYGYGWGFVAPYVATRPRPHRPPPDVRHGRQGDTVHRFIPVPPPVPRLAR